MEKSSEKCASIAFVVASDQISVITAAIVAKSEKLLSDPCFSVDNIFIINSQLISELHLAGYEKIYVIGLNEQNVGEKIMKSFLLENYKRLYFWYSQKRINNRLKIVLNDIMPGNVYTGVGPEVILRSRGQIVSDYMSLINTYAILKKGKGYKTELADDFKKALYASRIYDRLFSRKTEFKPITRKIMQKLFKVSLGFNSDSVTSMIKAYHEISQNNRESTGIQVNHKQLGKVEVIRPKDDLVDRKMFFKNLGQVPAIAVTALDKDPEGNIFEVCLNNESASKIDWKKVPYLERINGCRFLVNKEYVFENTEV
jgi:hypothetical protein